MKNKHFYIYSSLMLLMMAGLFSCKKSTAPTPADNFLDYTIPNVPVTSNYLVGAFYYSFSSFSTAVTEVPTVGKYSYTNGVPVVNGVATPAIMQQHIADADTAGIDYFIFPVRSPTLDNANYKQDSLLINTFQAQPNSSTMKFALSYTVNTGLLGVSNTVAIEANAAKLANFYNDFKRIAFWMNKSNYQKVNGKYILVINGAYNINSNNSVTLYQQIRTNLSAMGFQVYIVGSQSEWTPPARFYYRFQNCVDAMYEANMAEYANDIDRYNLFPQMCDQNWAYWKSTLESWNMEFIPCVQAGYNYQITAPSSSSLSRPRTVGGAWYTTYTNVAKRNASKSRLIFVDSFNNFTYDTQIEPTQFYGNNYLNITRTAFKVK
ncbi:glycoside hydrolase family 71/99 protein [Mucilaginibacter sp.]